MAPPSKKSITPRERKADNALMKMEDFRTQVEGNEFRVELTPDFYLIPINTGIKDLEESNTLTFSCGVYLGNVYMRQGSCWP